MHPSLVETIVESARAAPTAGYSERLDLLEKAAQTARSLCTHLTRADAKSARPAFFAVLEMPLTGGCAPQCCSASYVRAVEIEAKCEVLAAWKRLDPDVAIYLAPALVADLVVPSSKRISLATVELLAASPEACRIHLASLTASLAHPRWQVAEAAARGLAHFGPSLNAPASAALAEALGHEQWQVRRAVAKALGAITGGKHDRLDRIARHDSHEAVRNAGCKAIGKKIGFT